MKTKTSFLFATIALLSVFIQTVSAEVVTVFNTSSTMFDPVYIGQTPHMPFSLWLICLGLAFLLFFISIRWIERIYCPDITSALSTFFFSVLGITSFFVEDWSYGTEIIQVNETAKLLIQPVVYQLPGWTAGIMALMFVIGVINMYRIHLIRLEELSEIKTPKGEKEI